MVLTDLEQSGLKKMRILNKEYLAKNEGTDEVREFLSKATDDDALLLKYLKGRKYRPQHAWETLKRGAEVRFNEYPEVFSDETPECLIESQKRGEFGVLRKRDKLGRRVICVYGQKWDPDEFSMTDVTKAFIYLIEVLLKDEDTLNNGLVFIQNCEGMGMRHAKHYTLHAMLRIIHVFWYACPIKIKGVYFVNVPFYLTFVYGIIKPFFPKKLKERVFLSTNTKRFEELDSSVETEILPKFLGGEAEDMDAFDFIL